MLRTLVQYMEKRCVAPKQSLCQGAVIARSSWLWSAQSGFSTIFRYDTKARRKVEIGLPNVNASLLVCVCSFLFLGSVAGFALGVLHCRALSAAPLEAGRSFGGCINSGPFPFLGVFCVGCYPLSTKKRNICSGGQVLELPLDLCKLCCNQKDVRANIVFKIVSPPTQTGNLGSASTHVDL